MIFFLLKYSKLSKAKIQVIINEYHQILQSKLNKDEHFNLSLQLTLKSKCIKKFYKNTSIHNSRVHCLSSCQIKESVACFIHVIARFIYTCR